MQEDPRDLHWQDIKYPGIGLEVNVDQCDRCGVRGVPGACMMRHGTWRFAFRY